MSAVKRPRDRDNKVISVKTLAAGEKVHPITSDAATFLAPLSVEEFAEQHLETQRALAVKVHPRLRETRVSTISELCEGFNPAAMLRASNSEAISVWMKSTSGGALKQIKTTPEDAMKCYNAGNSLYFRGSEELESTMLTDFAKSVGFQLPLHRDGARRSEVEVFASHVGHTTEWHFDFQENFTIQLRGSKRWHMYPSGVKAPHRAAAPHFDRVENAEVLQMQQHTHCMDDPKFAGLPEDIDNICESVTLQPGDVLYHPPGMWHKVETIAVGDEPSNSLSINLSLFPMTWGELIGESLQQAMISSTALRRHVRFGKASEGLEIARNNLGTAQELLKALTPQNMLPQALKSYAPFYVLNENGKASTSEGKPLPANTIKRKANISPVATITPAVDPAPPIRSLGDQDSDAESDNESVEVPSGFHRWSYASIFSPEDAHSQSPALRTHIFVHPKMQKQFASAAFGREQIDVKQLASGTLDLLQYLGYLTQSS